MGEGRSNSQLNYIIDNTDIVEVISDFLILNKKGNNYWGVCPFHEDNSPSMSVSNEKKMFNCFSCHAGGNVVTFLTRKNGWNFFQAVEYLKNKNNLDINLDNIKSNILIRNENEQKIIEVNKDATKLFSFLIDQNSNINLKSFLEKRHLNKEIINFFEIGYSEKGIVEKLEKKGHDLATIINSSLAREDGKDYFFDRVIFPIKDEHGDIIGFSGRLLESNPSFAKYVNSAETSLFKKSKILYNYNNAIANLDREKNIYICEGFMDVIALYKDGIKNAVAIMGTALTDDHAKLLEHKNVVLFLDGDKAGVSATLKSIKTLLSHGIKVDVIENETNLDPDEYLNKNGIDSLKEMVKKKISAISFVYKLLSEEINIDNYDTIETFRIKISEYLNALRDWKQRDFFVNKIRNDYGVTINLNNNYQHERLTDLPKDNFENEVVVQTKKNSRSRDHYPKRIILFLLNNPDSLGIFIKNSTFDFVDIELREIYHLIKQYKNKFKVEEIIKTTNNHRMQEKFEEIKNINDHLLKDEKDLLHAIKIASKDLWNSSTEKIQKNQVLFSTEEIDEYLNDIKKHKE